jgi:hypothetical protein
MGCRATQEEEEEEEASITLESKDTMTKMPVLYFSHQIEFQFWSAGFDMKGGHVKQTTVKMILGQAYRYAYRFYFTSHLSTAT